jgi:predicted nucleic acid-binding protein
VTRYLIDTNVISEFRKRKPHGAVVAWIDSLHPEQMFLSAVTIGEIQAGVERTRMHDATKAGEIEIWLDHIEAAFPVVPMDGSCFREWIRLMAGKNITLREDAMIAATARVHGLTIATRNESDFEQLDVKLVNPFRFS